MKYVSFLLIILFAPTLTLCAQESERVVLISASEKPLTMFSRKELQLLFLGYPVKKDGKIIKPLINKTEEGMYLGFLQKIMFMSKTNYERKLVARVFRHGGVRPEQCETRHVLFQKLKAKPGYVTFVASTAVADRDDIQVVQRLW